MAYSGDTIGTLDGLFKTVYADSIVNLLPDFAILTKKVPFRPSEKIGRHFEVPVKLQYENGFSYSASGGGAFNLNGAANGVIAMAQVNASQMVLQSQIDYESAFKAAAGGKQAFLDATQAVVENMRDSFAKRQELACLYGGTGLSTIGSVSGSGGAATITPSAGTWAAGIFVGMVGAGLDAYNGSTKINTNAPLVITSVSIANKTVSVSGNSTDIAALSANQVLYFAGAYAQEMTGLDGILSNAGTLFGINAATYELWKSTQYAVGGAISMETALLAASQAVPLGLKEKTTLMLAPDRWTTLNNNIAALRRLDESYKMQVENGVEGITYHGVSGAMEIVSHPFVKEGDGFLIPDKRLVRVGSTDVTFRRPGNPNSFWRELEQQAGFELRAYSDQQIFLEAPSYAVKLTGITG
jgi:hypothetical protein